MNAIKLLQDHNIAVSEMRIEILEILSRSEIPLSFESFCLNANKTTFYRNMELFEKEGIVIRTEIERKGFYELANKAKAYFVCEVCKEISNVAMPTITSGKVKSKRGEKNLTHIMIKMLSCMKQNLFNPKLIKAFL